MSYAQWGYFFEGAFKDPGLFKPEAGVYVVWRKDGLRWDVHEIGEAENLRDFLNDVARLARWVNDIDGVTYFSASYTGVLTRDERTEIINIIKSHLRNEGI